MISLFCRMYQKRIITSEDGSHTIELIGQNEQYHSTHGAIQESNHVYIKNGLERVAQNIKTISILEVGMGTGLKVLLTWIYAKENGLKINYHAVEAYPVEKEIWNQLNYTTLVNNSKSEEIFSKIHDSIWNETFELDSNFSLTKMEESIIDSNLPNEEYVVVYFDAFNPDLEPNLWTSDLFKKIYRSMKSESILSTYSTKGIVKRAMKSCGFKIEKKPGPPGKREILNAVKQTI